jgi:hypothetical protein
MAPKIRLLVEFAGRDDVYTHNVTDCTDRAARQTLQRANVTEKVALNSANYT